MSMELFKEILSDVSAELGRQAIQGSAELAGALFNGDAYVPYGRGQQAPEHSVEVPATPEMPQQEMGGMEM